MKRLAANQQPVDLLVADNQLQREDNFYPITDELGEFNGYSTVYTANPDFNRLGSQSPSAYHAHSANPVLNASCDGLHRGRTNHFGFLHYSNVHETGTEKHHPEHAVAGPLLNNPSKILAGIECLDLLIVVVSATNLGGFGLSVINAKG